MTPGPAARLSFRRVCSAGARLTRAGAIACLALLLAGGCGPEPELPGTPAVFIAMAKDFAGYRDWEPFALGSEPGDGPHQTGPRMVYLNQRPPAGSLEFPVGTIVVKDTDGNQTFAMVKRGGGFNARGARGWEWFELKPAAGGGAPGIIWRGIVPPSGEVYAGIAGGTCNDCHAGGVDNDYVLASPLLLSGF